MTFRPAPWHMKHCSSETMGWRMARTSLPVDLGNPLGAAVDEEPQVVGVDPRADFLGMGRFQDGSVGGEDTHVGQTMAAPHHLQDGLHILAVAHAHGIEDGVFDGGEKELGTLPGGGHKVQLLPPDMEQGKDPDSGGEQEDGQDYDAADETL